MYLVADISVEICASKSCKLCTQYCPEANTILYSEEMGKNNGFKYGSAYVAVDRCKGCAQCVHCADCISDEKPRGQSCASRTAFAAQSSAGHASHRVGSAGAALQDSGISSQLECA